jgi:hypothetical protein
LLNELVNILEKEAREAKSNFANYTLLEKAPNGALNGMANGNHHKEQVVTWVHKIFQVNLCFIFFLVFILECSLLKMSFLAECSQMLFYFGGDFK